MLAYGLPPGLGSHVHWDRKLDARLAAALMEGSTVRGVKLHGDRLLELETDDLGGFAHVVPRVARDHGIRLLELTPTDESLESVFGYLVSR